MKEFSVDFYKKLIMFILALIFLSALFFSGFAIKAYFDNKKIENHGNTPSIGASEEQFISGDEIGKLAAKAESKKKELQGQQAAEAESPKPQEPKPQIHSEDLGSKEYYAEPKKVVYLTFEDGASKNTEKIIEILHENSVRATFFFNTNEEKSSYEIIKEAFDNGNAIGILTSSTAPLSEVYATPQDYGRDLDQSAIRIEYITGVRPDIVRFSGGSKNAYIGSRTQEFVDEVTRRNMVYFDWNLCAEGTGRVRNLDALVANATNIKSGTDRYILLMHDNGNVNTCEALRRVIKFYKNEGFEFMPLSSSVKPIVF